MILLSDTICQTQPKHLRIVRRQCYNSLKPDGSNDPASAEPNKVGPSATPRLVVVDVKRSRPENPTRVISHIHLGMRLSKRFFNISHSPVCTMFTPLQSRRLKWWHREGQQQAASAWLPAQGTPEPSRMISMKSENVKVETDR